MNFMKKARKIEDRFRSGEYTTAAKMCLEVLEQILRYVLQKQVTRLGEAVQLRIEEAERSVGKGEKQLDHFTMGQLVEVFRRARVVDAWELASGQELTGIRLLNLDELPRLRYKFVQEKKEATRTEAELLQYCLRVLGETFELISTKEKFQNAVPA